MNGNIQDLSRYSRQDKEKMSLIEDVYDEFPQRHALRSPFHEIPKKLFINEFDLKLEDSSVELTKYCPKCGEEYPSNENVCFDCLVHLKNISDRIEISEIESDPQFMFDGENSFDGLEDLLSEANFKLINEFNFTIDDYSEIIHTIKYQALKNFDGLVKSNEIDFDELDILDKIILFAKSFVKVNFKSSGQQLGYFEDDTIVIDDRQTDSLQITTLIHELSHFIIQEILVRVICRLLDATRNQFIESLVAFILSYSPFTQLIDEYSAHNVEGRFTVFGFQDYSSYLQIEFSLDGEMSREEIEITKSIGNTFAISIKGILESLIDNNLRKEIKKQFLNDVLDDPNYVALKMENCQILNDEGFIKAIWLVLHDGFEVALLNRDKFSKGL